MDSKLPSPRPGPTPRQQACRRTGKLMRHLLGEFRVQMDERLKDRQVTAAQLRILYELRQQPGATGAELARACFVTPQSMQSALARALERGWIARGHDPANHRLVTLHLKPAGERLLVHGERTVSELEAVAWAGVPAADLRALESILTRVLGNLNPRP